ncbi:sulfite exporter TauE/SafE family protein [Oceanicola sp. D3]|uniref:sulfite exporter TauE/SafE family protein n=1 Tax=Oceanicola sp. D3 TaxID=2587163 RepID=UPI0011220A47|nr:TSUP family transporter [Oceanicola sp. D3]QDC10275.1 sulfite exporter TauE/SafE family protein [Oceanicola sp. D3]
MIELFSAGLEPPVFWALIAVSFISSFITVALGIGGGALLLAVMASVMPPLALIPVHGVIQTGSNVLRMAVLIRHVHWPPVALFLLGTVIGVACGGSVVVNLPPGAIMIGVGGFVIWSVLARPPAWLSRLPLVTGLISSFLTMFFGATGVFVANFTKSLNLPRQSHVASHAAFMTLQHLAKVLVFGILGFAFGPWLGFLLVMILAGFLGTLAGRLVLTRLTDTSFRRALDVVLILISIRLIWMGLRSLF